MNNINNNSTTGNWNIIQLYKNHIIIAYRKIEESLLVTQWYIIIIITTDNNNAEQKKKKAKTK